MNRVLIAIVASFISLTSHAVGFSVYQAQGEKVFGLHLSADHAGKSVANITLESLREGVRLSRVSFVGDGSYIHEINGIGEKQVTVSSSETRYYGWCFSVNGKLPEVSASQVEVNSANDEITWFYGYVARVSGGWKAMCQTDQSVMIEVLKKIKVKHSVF